MLNFYYQNQNVELSLSKSHTMPLLTELLVHTGNICSDIQGAWTSRTLLYTYTNKIVYDEILLS